MKRPLLAVSTLAHGWNDARYAAGGGQIVDRKIKRTVNLFAKIDGLCVLDVLRAPPKAAGPNLSVPPRDGAQGEWKVAQPKGPVKRAA
eukprot:15459569-Alexandrium_andersonii.AAC.1